MIDIVLVGAGQYCRNVIDTIKYSYSDKYNIIGIIDNNLNLGDTVADVPVIGNDNDAREIFENKCQTAFISVGSIKTQHLRVKLFDYYQQIGYTFPVIIDRTAIVSKSKVILSCGVFIGKGAIINNNVIIKENCIINTGAIVEHDSIINKNSHIAPATTICGEITIGEETHVGANSVVIQGISIGNKSIIGAGSVVVRNIQDNFLAYGNPCKIIKKLED